jgi:hypothetical protein
MKIGYQLFNGLAVFYLLTAVLYWQIGGEAVGITAIGLSGGLAFIVGFYLWFTDRRSGGTLPEDNLEGEIADRAGEMGFFSPHSWWPLPVGLAMTAVGLGLIIGWWLTLIAAGVLIFSVIGFVLEYERPENSAH